MKKLALVPLIIALSATAACARNTGTPVNSAGVSAQTVELAEGGLTTGSRGLHHSTIIAFGTPRRQVLSLLRPALGNPSGTGTNAECPSGPVEFVSYGPLDLHFEKGLFTGWVLDEAGEPNFESYHGLSFGDRRSELDGDAEIEVVAESTLGTELTVNGIGVLMSGPGESDRVENLFAGTTCFAR